MSTAQASPQEPKKRLRQLFEYLVDYSRAKTPLRVHLRQYEWQIDLNNLPDHPFIRLCQGSSEDEFFLSVTRPRLTTCPPPPIVLREWLKGTWDRFEQEEPSLLTSVNRTDEGGRTWTEFFVDEDIRVDAWNAWTLERSRWREAEGPARCAEQLFNQLFSLRTLLEREGERFSFSLGTGFLHWKTKEGQAIQHPLITRRCSLSFDAEKSEFIVRFEDTLTELITSLLWDSAEVDTTGLPGLLQQFREEPFDPLTSNCWIFLRTLSRGCWKNGDFSEHQSGTNQEVPTVTSQAFLLLMPRGRDFVESAQTFLQNLDSYTIPPSLLQIIGLEPTAERKPEGGLGAQSVTPLLFTMASNPEQEKVARRLQRSGSVLVQGPPGTGKTHTIANLIGHLLAEGKSILVTSHTSKALRVLRDKVVPTLRGLCVAVLDDEREGQKQLEFAVKSLADKLTATDERALTSAAQNLSLQRSRLESRLREAEANLERAHRSEFEDLVIGGQAVAPCEAARRLNQGRGVHDWLPGPVTPGAACPLSPSEFEGLYRLQGEISKEEEASIKLGLPAPSCLPTCSEFEDICRILDESDRVGTQYGINYWKPVAGELDDLRSVLTQIDKLTEPLQTKEKWILECLQSGLDSAETELWKELVHKVKSIAARAPALRSLASRREMHVNGPLPPEVLLKDCDEVLARLKNRERPSWLDSIRGEFGRLGKFTTVAGHGPKTREDFQAVRAGLELRILRQELHSYWALQVTGHGGPALSDDEPERSATELIPMIESSLAWAEEWIRLKSQLDRLGVLWEKLLTDVPLVGGSHSLILRYRLALDKHLRLTLEGRMRFLERQRAESIFKDALQHLRTSESDCAGELALAIQNRDPASYERGLSRLNSLLKLTASLEQREKLLQRLVEVAPGWAEALRNRAPAHVGPEAPGELEPAWNFRQWTEELKRRHQADLDDLQTRCHHLRAELQEVTASYVESLTWGYQLRRTGVGQRQALQGWLQIQSRIGKGTGKNVHLLRKAGRERMVECRSAVPVWIMPLNRVFESYRPGSTLFDVVIIDEASQAELTGLLALTLGRQVVVVGDHEQVSPSAVGERVEQIFELADKHLRGLPNRELFDGKSSVYDIAQRSFGETIRLREHFRCVPEIISFSNALCYDGDILPLRERDENIQPATLCHRVANGYRRGDENENEAREIAALIAAAIEQPEYLGKTFGMISLIGDKQALLTENILREHLDTVILERRRILCGNPAQFQGDERDVVFLSMVDSPSGGGPLRLVPADTRSVRQRYNVAASRARDQMWVVHSLSPANDLKPDDIRFRLLKHAQQAHSVEDEVRRLKNRTESPFEEQVMAALVTAGYRVEAQMPIGAYRIDLVVIGTQRRVAVECDGDRFHPPEKLQEDLRRQEILERVGGLVFIRIRGSAFYLDPCQEMQRVFRRLEELNIEKLGVSAPKERQDFELRNRVVQRAQQLLREWFLNETNDLRSPFEPEEGAQSTSAQSPEQDTTAIETSTGSHLESLQETYAKPPAAAEPASKECSQVRLVKPDKVPKVQLVKSDKAPKVQLVKPDKVPKVQLVKPDNVPKPPGSRAKDGGKSSERPCLNLSTAEIEALIRSGQLTPDNLELVKAELKHRARSKAKHLLKQLDETVPSFAQAHTTSTRNVLGEERPYINLGIESLEALVAEPKTSRAELESVRAELAHRSSGRARKLSLALDQRLGGESRKQ